MMFMSVFWILIFIVGLLFLFKWLNNKSTVNSVHSLLSGSNSLDILKERYARGEISRGEFENKKHDLKSS